MGSVTAETWSSWAGLSSHLGRTKGPGAASARHSLPSVPDRCHLHGACSAPSCVLRSLSGSFSRVLLPFQQFYHHTWPVRTLVFVLKGSCCSNLPVCGVSEKDNWLLLPALPFTRGILVPIHLLLAGCSGKCFCAHQFT